MPEFGWSQIDIETVSLFSPAPRDYDRFIRSASLFALIHSNHQPCTVHVTINAHLKKEQQAPKHVPTLAVIWIRHLNSGNEHR